VTSRAVTKAARERKCLRRKNVDVLWGGARSKQSDGWFKFFGVIPHSEGYRFAPDRRLLFPLRATTVRIQRTKAVSGTSLGGGNTEYQENVYSGPPSKYWEIGKTSNGAGTAGNPYQYSQLAANIAAGDICGFLPGAQQLAIPGDNHTPVFNPGVSGTQFSRIVYVGKYDPGTMGNPLTDGNRSQIGHTGGSTEANWRPTIGWNGIDDVTFDSIVMDSAYGKFIMDAGAIIANDTVRPRAYRLWVQAETLASPVTLSNYCALWNTVSTDLHIADCTFKGFRYTGSTTTNISVFILYSANNFLIENCTIEDCNQALYQKGQQNEAGGLNWGIFRRNRIIDCGAFARIQASDATRYTDIYQNLATGIERYGFNLQNAGVGDWCRKLRVHNNTLVFDGDGDVFGTGGDSIDSEDISYFENIAQVSASGGYYRWLPTGIGLTRMRNNDDYRASGSHQYAINGSAYTGISAYQTALNGITSANAREEGSSNANPDLHATTYRPQAGAAALTMGTASGLGGAGGEIGYGGGNPTVGRR
jgi:hypothetical protein